MQSMWNVGFCESSGNSLQDRSVHIGVCWNMCCRVASLSQDMTGARTKKQL
jgi:hypothetical protein